MWVELAIDATCRVTPRMRARRSLSRAALGWSARWHRPILPGCHRQQSTQRAAQDDATMSKRFDVLFCGSDVFAEIILARLIRERHLYNSLQVLTSHETASEQTWGGSRMRTSPVKELALRHSLHHHAVPKAGIAGFDLPNPFTDAATSAKTTTPLLITASFGHFLPDSFLSAFTRHGWFHALNVHPSLLPKLRGAAPIQWAIARSGKPDPVRDEEGEDMGVTIQELSTKGFDRGRILLQNRLAESDGRQDVQKRWTYAILMPLLARQGADALVQVLASLEECAANSQEQDESKATRAPKLRADKHGMIKWEEWTAEEIDARWRGFGGHFPFHSILIPSSPSTNNGAARAAVPRTTQISFHDIGLVNNQAVTASSDQNHRASTSRSAGLSVSHAISILSEPTSRPGHAVYCHLVASTPNVGDSGREASPGLLVKCAPPRHPSTTSTKDAPEESYVVIREVQQPSKRKRRVDDEWWNGFRDRADERGRLLFMSMRCAPQSASANGRHH